MVKKGSFNIDVYDCKVNITIADDIVRSINYYNHKYGYENIESPLEGYCIRFDNENVTEYNIFISFFGLSINTINHEKSHLVEFILTDRDIRAKDEVRAWLDGCVSKKIDTFFKRNKIKIKK